MNSLGVSSRTLAGLILAVVGALLLMTSLGLGEGGLFKWLPSLFILLGLWALAKNRFRSATGPLIVIAIAVVVQFALLGGIESEVFWAAALIAIGIAIIFGGTRTRKRIRRAKVDFKPIDSSSINSFSVWGSTKSNVESEDFQGGEVTALMGAVSLDLRDAVVNNKPARLEISAIMGEVKLRVPAAWKIHIENTTMMGETNDKRRVEHASDRAVDLVITGTVLMGNLQIDD
jgi:predicted membrane protein